MQKKKVIFSDLDGTLINTKYSFKDAKPALDLLKEQELPLVLCSSKTRAEIEVYRRRLGNKEPFISENGGAIFIPVNYFSGENLKRVKKRYEVIQLGTSYGKLLDVLGKIRRKVHLTGFSDMSAQRLAEESGLSLEEAKLAKKREYDEAFFIENKRDEGRLKKLIRRHGLNYAKGGRYYHILGNNDKGKAVRILIDFFKDKYKKVLSISFGDSDNDLPMIRETDKGFLIKGPGQWNDHVIRLLNRDREDLKKFEKLYWNSVRILRRLQLSNGAILASPPKSRYPYVYPRDHSVCSLAFIDMGDLKRARKSIEFILKCQNPNGGFPQRLDRNGRNASYKPVQLDNTGLVLYAFARYVQESLDKRFLDKYKDKIKKSVEYLRSQLHKKNLFFTPNSIHEFPPYEEGLEVWANGVCLGALRELEKIGIKSRIDLEKVGKSIKRYLWNGEYLIKNIRLKESSSVASEIDSCAIALEEFGIFDEDSVEMRGSVKEIEKELWHKELGGICRYKRHIGRNNGGWGPWPHFSLMIAKHYIKLRDKKKADKYLNWVLNVSLGGLLPEHIALKEDFEKWVKEYQKAGLIRRDREIMIENIRKNKLYREKGIAYSVLPLAWPHAEFIRTWNLYKDRFL